MGVYSKLRVTTLVVVYDISNVLNYTTDNAIDSVSVKINAAANTICKSKQRKYAMFVRVILNETVIYLRTAFYSDLK